MKNRSDWSPTTCYCNNTSLYQQGSTHITSPAHDWTHDIISLIQACLQDSPSGRTAAVKNVTPVIHWLESQPQGPGAELGTPVHGFNRLAD